MKPKFKKGDIVVHKGSQGKIILKIDKVWSMQDSKDLIKSASDDRDTSIDRFYTCDKANGLFAFVNEKFLKKATKKEIKDFAADIL